MTGDIVLLTGATGFIGFRTLVMLLEAGYNVRAAVRNVGGFDKIKNLKSVAPYQSLLQYIVVPDITIPGAYNDAVKGVKYIVHVASPFASPNLLVGDFESGYIQPAIKGTVGMLDAAATVTGIERVIITASILSIASLNIAGSDIVVNEAHRSTVTTGPYQNWVSAYSASKALALEATKTWVAVNAPQFSVINIEPAFVIGRDETAEDPNGLFRGANNIVMGPLVGKPSMTPNPDIPVHVDDVAMMHVRSLDPSIPSNEDYLACSHPLQTIQWDQVFDIVKKHFPKDCAEGVLKVDTAERPKTVKLLVDSTEAEKTFDFTFKPLEDQVVSVVRQYLELLGRE